MGLRGWRKEKEKSTSQILRKFSVLICKNYAVSSSGSGVYYYNGEPVVNQTVTPEEVLEEDQKRTCAPKSPPTLPTNVTMTTHTTKIPTTRVDTQVKNTVTMRTVTRAKLREAKKKDEKKNKKGEKNKTKNKNRRDGKKKEDKEENKGVKNKKNKDKEDDNDDDDDEDDDEEEDDAKEIKTSCTTENPEQLTQDSVSKSLDTSFNVMTRTVSVAKESYPTKYEKTNSHWQLPVGVAAGGLVLVLVLVGFLIRRRWAGKAEGDLDIYAEISDVQPKDESCSSSPTEHPVYHLASAPATQEEVISMNPIYHTIQDPNLTTNIINGEKSDEPLSPDYVPGDCEKDTSHLMGVAIKT